MGRVMCFFDEKDGQWALCPDKFEGDCSSCKHNPFPGNIIPEDRILRKPKIPFEYELLTDEEYAEMMAGRVQGGVRNYQRTIWYRRTSKNNSRCFHHRHNVRR